MTEGVCVCGGMRRVVEEGEDRDGVTEAERQRRRDIGEQTEKGMTETE